MLAAILFSVQAAYSVAGGAGVPNYRIYSGRAGRIQVQAPRVETEISVDGRLDEPAWTRAAGVKTPLPLAGGAGGGPVCYPSEPAHAHP